MNQKPTKDNLYLSNYGRSWGDKITFTTGSAYLAGLFSGSSYGALKALDGGGPTLKLKINKVMNGCRNYGSKFGNEAAAMTLAYCLINGFVGALRRKDENVNALLSGATVGILVKWGYGITTLKYATVSTVVYGLLDKYLRS